MDKLGIGQETTGVLGVYCGSRISSLVRTQPQQPVRKIYGQVFAQMAILSGWTE